MPHAHWDPRERWRSASRPPARREFRDYGEPSSLRLADLPTHGDWVLLGEDAPNEIAFGVIGRFWAGETKWRQIDASEFRDFAEPGYARIACSFSLRPYGAERTLVTYESRTHAVDDRAAAAFCGTGASSRRARA